MRIYTLSEALYAHVPQIGQKAAMLARLHAKGFRVCEGIVLDTDTFYVLDARRGFGRWRAFPGQNPRWEDAGAPFSSPANGL